MAPQSRRVAVVTGASAGVGRATALKFADLGYSVALLARGEAGLEAAAKEVDSVGGGRVLPLQVDVADNAAVEQAAQAIEDELGPIDVWVNNAFSSIFATFLDITAEEFERINDVTYIGFVNGTRAAMKRMVPRNRGAIVQVGSALAYRGIPLQTAYCGAKHAIQGFTESVRCELLHQKSDVRISMVQLPAINTPQFDWVLSRLPRQSQPVPPIYQPEVAADAIVWAAENYRREWYVTWQSARAILANAVFPGLLDRYLGRTGFESQQTNERTDPNRPSNLWKPVDQDVDFGTHGSFGSVARHGNWQWPATKRRRLVWSGVAAVGAGAIGLVVGRR